MKRRLLVFLALTAVLICLPITSADAAGGRGLGVKGGHGFGHRGGFGIGFGGCDDICGYAELYRELLRNVPYFALHPPVYYSYPVPRTYGYSPFAYPPGFMTPEIIGEVEPLEIINPHVEGTDAKPTANVKTDRTAATNASPEPLVVINPFVAPNQTVAQNR